MFTFRKAMLRGGAAGGNVLLSQTRVILRPQFFLLQRDGSESYFACGWGD